MLTKERILGLFAELDADLCRIGVRGDVFVVGGAAMAVAYDARPATRDVDAIWHPTAELRSVAERIAGRHDDLEPGWLNDAQRGQPAGVEGEGLLVGRAVSDGSGPPPVAVPSSRPWAS